MTASDVFVELTLNGFIQDYLGRNYYVAPGCPGRFAELVPWQDLNDALSRMRPGGDRMRLVTGGQSIPKHQYLIHDKLPEGSLLRSASVQALLRQGATLILNAVDELFPRVQALTESFETILRLHIAANLYAGWRRQHGFDLHWDDHDTLILQVHGRKHWAVYEPTVVHPTDLDEKATPKPTNAPVWEGLLEEGSVLYMPRGWWHVATPINEASLHLTVGFCHPRGLDFLKWAVSRIATDEVLRMDVPHLAPPPQQQEYRDKLRRTVESALASATLDEFMTMRESSTAARPRFTLPTLESQLPASMQSLCVRLTRTRRLPIRRESPRTISFDVGGKQWECSAVLQPALELLTSLRATTLSELERATPEDSVGELRAVLVGLLTSGVVQQVG